MTPRAMSGPVKPQKLARTKNVASKDAIEMAVGSVSRFSCRNIIAYIIASPYRPDFVWAGVPTAAVYQTYISHRLTAAGPVVASALA